MVHILADSAPDAGFEAVNPDLEDVYFSEIKNYELRSKGGAVVAV